MTPAPGTQEETEKTEEEGHEQSMRIAAHLGDHFPVELPGLREPPQQTCSNEHLKKIEEDFLEHGLMIAQINAIDNSKGIL